MLDINTMQFLCIWLRTIANGLTEWKHKCVIKDTSCYITNKKDFLIKKIFCSSYNMEYPLYNALTFVLSLRRRICDFSATSRTTAQSTKLLNAGASIASERIRERCGKVQACTKYEIRINCVRKRARNENVHSSNTAVDILIAAQNTSAKSIDNALQFRTTMDSRKNNLWAD